MIGQDLAASSCCSSFSLKQDSHWVMSFPKSIPIGRDLASSSCCSSSTLKENRFSLGDEFSQKHSDWTRSGRQLLLVLIQPKSR
jgi:hypothetical protein